MKGEHFRSLKFVKTLANIPDIVKWATAHERYPQFAFIGKSNVGKSSLINHLSQNKGIAKVSSTPGKTQAINVFQLKDCFIMDLPGYGFAQVSKELKKNWNEFIGAYLQAAQKNLNIFILLDPKKPVSEEDFFMMEICMNLTIPFGLIFTKIDQIPPTKLQSVIKPRLSEIKSFLNHDAAFVLYSNKSMIGRDALVNLIEERLSHKGEST